MRDDASNFKVYIKDVISKASEEVEGKKWIVLLNKGLRTHMNTTVMRILVENNMASVELRAHASDRL